jgi:uncharacterized protein YjiS (DUF1127 family)
MSSSVLYYLYTEEGVFEMEGNTDRTNQAISIAKEDNWIASIMQRLITWRNKNRDKTMRKKLLSYDDDTLMDIGLSRTKLIKELGFDPAEAQRTYTVFAFPYLYLSVGSAMTKNHTK